MVVEGGRSRLHLIDLGGCANRSGGLPLSGIGNVLLAILSGQKHPPNRDHPLTPLLRDCLAPLTCHVAIVAHVAHSQVRFSVICSYGRSMKAYSIPVTYRHVNDDPVGLPYSSASSAETSTSSVRRKGGRTCRVVRSSIRGFFRGSRSIQFRLFPGYRNLCRPM